MFRACVRRGRRLVDALRRRRRATIPSRTIEMIVPFAAGGGVDLIGRAIAASLPSSSVRRRSSQNRDGAAGTIGFRALAAAPPDGYTLGFGPSTPIANAPYLVKGVRYNAEFLRLYLPGFRKRVLHRRRSQLDLQDAKEFIAAAGDKGLNFGHPGRRLDPASVGREPGRGAEGESPASAVPRRRRDPAGAAQGRSRFRRRPRCRRSAATIRSVRWWCFPTSAIRSCRTCRPPGTRRDDVRIARPERHLRAEGPAGGGEAGPGAWLRGCRPKSDGRAEGHRQYRSKHRLSRRHGHSATRPSPTTSSRAS